MKPPRPDAAGPRRGEPGPRVVVLGAGLAGLTAARFLQEIPAARILVLEKEKETGGLARTVRDGGFCFDLGIHGCFPSSRAGEPYFRLAGEIMGEEKVVPSKSTAIFFRRRLIKYPLGVRELFLSLSPREMLLCASDFLLTRARLRWRGAPEGNSFHELITSRFGRRLYRIYFGPYAEKTWGIAGEKLDGRHLFRRVTTVSLADVIAKAFSSLVGRRRKTRMADFPQQPPTCLYGVTGSHVLVDRMAAAFDPERVTIATEARITGIGLAGGRIASVSYEQGGERKEEAADFVVSTIPITDLARYVLKEDYSDRLRFRAMVLVHVALSGPDPAQQWVYFPDQGDLFNRMNNYSLLSPRISPPGTSAVNFEITCFEGDAVWSRPDAETAEEVLGRAEALGFLDRRRVLKSFVTRQRHAYPVYLVDTDELLLELKSRLAFPNLFPAGRQGNFFYLNMDEAMAQGHAAARRIKEAIDDDDQSLQTGI